MEKSIIDLKPQHEKTGLIEKRFRILLGGYINLNAVDGSAFFMAGLSAMCAQQPNIEITLVTANPIRKTEVVNEILYYPNVTIIDPFRGYLHNLADVGANSSSLTRTQYATVLYNVYSKGNFDAILIRDNEVAFNFVNDYPEVASKTIAYVTNITNTDIGLDEDTNYMLTQLANRNVKFACQTLEIKELLLNSLSEYDASQVFILPPHIPDSQGTFEEVFNYSKCPSKLVYTGKFFEDWNPDLFIAAFKAARMSSVPLSLTIAGDHFKHSKTDPFFVKNVKYLLNNTEGLKWYGGIPRHQARDLIRGSDVGIGWRSNRLDNSTELSTKILEYGALGRPTIINRTKMHERIFGVDYPLYANTMQEIMNLFQSLPQMQREVEVAARKTYDVAKNHWYSSVLPTLMKNIGNVPSSTTPKDNYCPLSANLLQKYSQDFLSSKGRVRLEGIWVIIEPDLNSTHTIGELLTFLECKYRFWQAEYSSRILESSNDDSQLCFSDESGKVSRKDAIKNIETLNHMELREKITNLLISEKKMRGRMKEMADQIAYYEKISEHYKALQQSKLGSLQRKIWRLRSKRR
ncbi:MAG: hypothetical protein Q4P66_08800 [Actinomycetaceae bacterium]|nr:hypothetical protein [Actinomycetaceae bacterium]